jgi:hypothetical protein
MALNHVLIPCFKLCGAFQVIDAGQDLQETHRQTRLFSCAKELAEKLKRSQIGDARLGGFTVFVADFSL